MASKFFEHFISIADAINNFDGTGLWDETDGFYYDHLRVNGSRQVLRTRSMVGLIPMLAVEVLEDSQLEKLRGFGKRVKWFLKYRPDLARLIAWCTHSDDRISTLLALPNRGRLERLLRRVLDETEFFSPHGIRSLSAMHRKKPFCVEIGGESTPEYAAGNSPSWMFGGNSNWRGPIWFPIDYLLLEALERYRHFYGDTFSIECPTGSGVSMNLDEVARELSRRLANLFLPDALGTRPCHGGCPRIARIRTGRIRSLPRILSRRRWARPWRFPPNRLDRCRSALHGGYCRPLRRAGATCRNIIRQRLKSIPTCEAPGTTHRVATRCRPIVCSCICRCAG